MSERRAFPVLVILCVLAGMLAGCIQPAPLPAGPRPADELILATTTSTADSGLLDFILPDFEQQNGVKVRVVAVGSGQAIAIGRRGDADVLLVHDRQAEEQFVADGHAAERFDVMYNDFIVVGPEDDPAGVAGMATAREAFTAIARAAVPFASRGDRSGTHAKELSIWSSAGITPTREMAWYNSLGQGMGDTLLFAGETGAYTLADRSTYLAMRDKLPNLVTVVGGNNPAENRDEVLLNRYSVLAVNPAKHPAVKAGLAGRFVRWITSAETQEKIAAFGWDRFGQPLFYPNSAEHRAAPAAH